MPGFKLIKPLQGANNSTQYVAVIGYASLLDEQLEPIRVEIGLREPHLTETVTGQAKTALLNPLDGQDLVDACPARCLSYQETVAEKLRAAVCRREIAIRDYFDVDYIVQNNEFNLWDDNLIALLKQKIAIPGTGAINLSEQRLAQLDKQLDAQLRPVLRANDFSSFELERATATVQRLIEHLE